MPKMSDEQQKTTESDISLPSVPASQKSVIMVKSDDESGEDDESKNKPWVKIGDSIKHQDDLLGGKWLNDCHIHAAQ